jgi:dTDP-L-rhamnose 4-epimerase
VDVVCHQAAMVGAGVTPADLPAYAGHNDLGHAALLAGMYAAGVSRLVFASSMVVYGEGRYACPDHGDQVPPPRQVAALEAGDFDNHCTECGKELAWQPVTESARLEPRSSYAASKVAQEHYALAWARQAGAAAIGLRYHNVYGPRMPRDTPYSGVAAIFRSSLEQGEPPQVFEDGRQMRDFVHVDDVARANLLALRAVGEAPAESYRAYNVASGRPIAIREVAELLGRDAPTPIVPEVTGGYRLGDVRHIVASPDLARTELGFTETRYPYQDLSRFDSDDERLVRVKRLAFRTLQQCSHETTMDCPFYEQLQYAGDTRIQCLVAYLATGDDRLARQALLAFDRSRSPRGLTTSRYPSRIRQTIPPFSLWWIAMVHDFALWRGDLDFVRTLMPGVRAVLDAHRTQVGPDGLFSTLDGWNFMDWVDGWESGTPGDVRDHALARRDAGRVEQRPEEPVRAWEPPDRGDGPPAADRAAFHRGL